MHYLLARDLSRKAEASQILAKFDESLISYFLGILKQINSSQYFSEAAEAQFGVQLEIQIIRVLNLLTLSGEDVSGLGREFSEFIQVANEALRKRFDLFNCRPAGAHSNCKSKAYLELCVSLWSRSVLPVSSFLECFSCVFSSPSNSPDFAIFESVISKFNQIKIEETESIPDMFEVDSESTLHPWLNLIRLVTAICLLKHFPDQKESITATLRVLLPKLCSHLSVDQSELVVFLDVFNQLILTLKQDADFAFTPIWGFLTAHVLCTRTPPPFYDRLHHRTIDSALGVATLMLQHFPGQRAFLFQALAEQLTDNEHILLFLTRHLKSSSKNDADRQDLLINSRFSLESHVMGEFWQKINGDAQSRLPATGSDSVNAESMRSSENSSCGIVNLGATCYFNSLIQQFANMDWFVELILNHCAQSDRFEFVTKMDQGSPLNADNRRAEFARELGTFLLSMYRNKKQSLFPFNLLESFTEINPKLQRDVYEFFNEFQDNLEKSLLEDEDSHSKFTQRLGGEFINEIRFSECGHVTSMPPEKFIVLSLEVRNMRNIRAALEYFSHWELLQAEPKECPQCGQKSPREKRTRIGQWPKELIIHLKRFQFEKGRFIKLNDGFSFTETLDIETDSGDKSFSLQGAICHAGSVEYGHYVSLIRGTDSELDLADDDAISDQETDHLFKYNYQSRSEDRGPSQKETFKWKIYNDREVSECPEQHIPGDCFGQFENNEEYSFDRFKGRTQEASKKEYAKKPISKGKTDILCDLGVFPKKLNSSDKKDDDSKAETVPRSLTKGMNAYMLFFRMNQSPEEEIPSTTKILASIDSSDFAQKVQQDLDRELILEKRLDYFKSDSGHEFVNGVVKGALRSCFDLASQANLDFLLDSCNLAANHFFGFHCKTLHHSQKSLHDSADLILRFLSPTELLRMRQKQLEIDSECSLSDSQLETLARDFSLNVLSMVTRSSVEYGGAETEDNLMIQLISSRIDLFSSNGLFAQQNSMKIGKTLEIDPLFWVFQILFNALSNLVPVFERLAWRQQRIVIEFLKTCVKHLVLHKIFASAILVILERAFESEHLVWLLFRNGFPGVVSSLVPQIFGDLKSVQLRGWSQMRRLFSNFSPNDKRLKTAQDYYLHLHSHKSPPSKGEYCFPDSEFMPGYSCTYTTQIV